MCFSATASFTAGSVLAVIGTMTLRRADGARELPYALIPTLFAAQQFVEGGLWLTFAGSAAHLNATLTHIYQFFSHVLWPVYVPIAVLLLERTAWRRRALQAFAAAGAGVGLYLAFFLVSDPTISRVTGGHVDYVSPHFYVVPVVALYVLATCVSPLVSSHSPVRWFGVVTSASLAAAAIFYLAWFISVWCFFAALMSVVVLAYFIRRTPSAVADIGGKAIPT